MSSKHVVPQCLALILCDTVIEDRRTRNKSLINMFNGVLAPSVPVRHDKMCAFTAFTGGRGTVPIALRLCFDKEYEKDLLRLTGSLAFPPNAPHALVDMVFEIRGFVFPQFGNYTFEVVHDEVPLMARRFSVNEAEALPLTPPPG